jgi:hypothetical protein
MKHPSKLAVLCAALSLMAIGALTFATFTSKAWAVSNNQAKPGKFQCVAVAVQTTATTVISGSSEHNAWLIQNLGPNPIYCGGTASVATTTGVQVPANGGVLSADMWGGNLSGVTTITCIAATANQTTPLDTRKCEVY